MWTNIVPLFLSIIIFSTTQNKTISFLKEALVFRFTNFECKTYNQSWFVFHHCRLKAVNRERVLLNVNGTILHPAHNIQLHAKIYKKASGFKPWLIDSKVDACRFMRKRYDPFLGIVFNIFQEFSNINHTCPYVGLQVVKDFYLRAERLNLPVPSGEYLLAMQWYFDKKRQFDTNVSFVYEEDLLKRN
ncbi:uncharacterized protein LOC108027980 [Drosophila biarmipes]|uniref:uncharacterized protein LOC108027980 n=1 Tax=Drosophila biarmipes TaxID=125945 RepID=UPI0007E66A00|nr:uncharacterized protein LOC108027980 [Drosophila biarmipes]